MLKLFTDAFLSAKQLLSFSKGIERTCTAANQDPTKMSARESQINLFNKHISYRNNNRSACFRDILCRLRIYAMDLYAIQRARANEIAIAYR
jgi:hypothetical protein